MPTQDSRDAVNSGSDEYRSLSSQHERLQLSLQGQLAIPKTDSPPSKQTSIPIPIPTPSSSITGFFQAPPPLPNAFESDTALLRALALFVPTSILSTLAPTLSTFATKTLSPQIQSHISNAERQPPHLVSHDTFGRRRDELVTSHGWKSLQSIGIAEGIVAIPYENEQGPYSRIHQFAKYVLWAPSAAWVNCPSLMVDGVASLYRKVLTQGLSGREERVIRSAYERLTSRGEDAWTTGQWMTERQGGSDVSMTETLARYDPQELKVTASDGQPLGPWILDGFKWFSSATDADMMVLLARTPKGISLFHAPMRKKLASPDVLGNETELNGVTIQRLKNKLGTRALPTAELELKSVRAWLIGEEGKGTKEIATVLNIARVHNGVTAIGFWGRGLGVVRAFTRVRVVGRRPLWERTAFMRGLAKMHVQYRADVLFNFFVAGLLGVVEQEQIAAFGGKAASSDHKFGQVPGLTDSMMAEHLLRLLTPALKGYCSKTAIAGLQECMECMGGVGYLENDDMQYNIARLYRDANVLPIWEGTTDMMADDSVLRVLYGKNQSEARKYMSLWTETLLSYVRESARFPSQTTILEGWWRDMQSTLEHACRDEAESQARAIMCRLVDIVEGLLLMADALRDDDEVAGLVVQTWFAGKQGAPELRVQGDWQSQVQTDLKIVFGVDGPGPVKARL